VAGSAFQTTRHQTLSEAVVVEGWASSVSDDPSTPPHGGAVVTSSAPSTRVQILPEAKARLFVASPEAPRAMRVEDPLPQSCRFLQSQDSAAN